MTYMSPGHPEWPEFIERLAGPEACDVSKGGSWRCHNDTRGTEAILRKHHPDCDLATTLGFFASQGGHCDCEVILNVRPLGGEGYDWLIERALDLRGDLMRILAVRPPAGSSIAFEQEFQSASMDLVDALVPEGIEIQRYLADHIPDAEDVRSVQALARSRLPRAPGRF
jgi:hypothetical protein